MIKSLLGDLWLLILNFGAKSVTFCV
jgi:hypothetical protein